MYYPYSMDKNTIVLSYLTLTTMHAQNTASQTAIVI